jgi:hypothetical protein
VFVLFQDFSASVRFVHAGKPRVVNEMALSSLLEIERQQHTPSPAKKQSGYREGNALDA